MVILVSFAAFKEAAARAGKTGEVKDFEEADDLLHALEDEQEIAEGEVILVIAHAEAGDLVNARLLAGHIASPVWHQEAFLGIYKFSGDDSDLKEANKPE